MFYFKCYPCIIANLACTKDQFLDKLPDRYHMVNYWTFCLWWNMRLVKPFYVRVWDQKKRKEFDLLVIKFLLIVTYSPRPPCTWGCVPAVCSSISWPRSLQWRVSIQSRLSIAGTPPAGHGTSWRHEVGPWNMKHSCNGTIFFHFKYNPKNFSKILSPKTLLKKIFTSGSQAPELRETPFYNKKPKPRVGEDLSERFQDSWYWVGFIFFRYHYTLKWNH